MPSAAVLFLQRRQRQRQTLRKMIEGVDALLEALEEIAGERSLTPEEEVDKAALLVRRDRIDKSISELESSESREGVRRA